MESHPVILRNINSFSKRNPLDTTIFFKDSLHLMNICEYNGAPIERNTGHYECCVGLFYATPARRSRPAALSRRVPGGAHGHKRRTWSQVPLFFCRTEAHGADDKLVFGGRL